MTMDLESLAAGLSSAVPMVRTLDLEFVDVGPGTAVMRLPDNKPYQNHIGGPHAGAMFTLGESASGAVVISEFGDLLAKATPLVSQVKITYKRVAMGPLTASAQIDRDLDEVRAEVADGKRPEFDVIITLADESGKETGEMVATWTLKPNS